MNRRTEDVGGLVGGDAGQVAHGRMKLAHADKLLWHVRQEVPVALLPAVVPVVQRLADGAVHHGRPRPRPDVRLGSHDKP